MYGTNNQNLNECIIGNLSNSVHLKVVKNQDFMAKSIFSVYFRISQND